MVQNNFDDRQMLVEICRIKISVYWHTKANSEAKILWVSIEYSPKHMNDLFK